MEWLELLKEIAPGVKRAAVIRTLATAAGPGPSKPPAATFPGMPLAPRGRVAQI